MPVGTDPESIEHHDGPFSDGVTSGSKRFGEANRGNVPSLRPTGVTALGQAPLAQSVERFHGKEKVNGSIPLGGSRDVDNAGGARQGGVAQSVRANDS